ncbi:MAG: error-prone DNA polymerase [Verrucomicrobiota bacterium JB023]|nr:error-prone DNA polymerase [Verrucomicrobiota bacterium JB023]
MPLPPYIEHLATSSFSFLRGGSSPEEFIKRAEALGYPALSLPDYSGFYGSARAHTTALALGISAHVGATLPFQHHGFIPPDPDKPEQPVISLLCPTKVAYQSLSQLLTDLHLSSLAHLPASETPSDCSVRYTGPEPISKALIALTGHPGTPLYHAILTGNYSSAQAHIQALLQLFGPDHLYLVLTRHHTRHDKRLTNRLAELSEAYRLPLIVSNAPLHATRQDRLIADLFTCLRHHTTLDEAGTLLAPNAERHLKSPREMAALFPDQPEALHETLRLNERLEFTLQNLGYRFPSLLPEHRDDPDAAHQMLTALCHNGLKTRYDIPSKKASTQLRDELALIRKLEFSGYFLIVHDIIRFANSQGILCQGRGSAANSVVCYVLGLTAVDPIGGKLLFERFLSENRQSWPDIDIDFPSGERRESVIQYVFQKYGSRGAAMTANVITYRSRSAFRELTKVLGFPDEIANRFSDINASPRSENPGEEIPKTSGESQRSNDQSEIANLESLFQQAGIPSTHPRQKALLHLFPKLLSYPRHLGQHSGGIIICDSGLDHIVPIQPASMPGRTIVQWDKDDCEDLGIVKIDLLGLGMLAAMEDSIRLCAQRGKQIDLAKIPKDDPATFDLMCRADTIGTFQVESRAQMNTLPILRPRHFYDVAIEVAIIRPGPIVGELAHPYLNRRQGFEKVDTIHPLFEDTLKRTLGVPLFQEQVLKMAMLIADFTGTEADELRRAMAFKRSDEKMEAVAKKLRRNMNAKGIAPDVQDKVVNAIGSFALYGFPESHAISFALIAYASCWLKAHHPAEFYAGLINNQPMGFYNVNTLLQDAKRHGIRTRPISIIHSQYQTTLEDPATSPLSPGKDASPRHPQNTQNPHPALRLGLHRLKGLTQTTAERILTERQKSPFTSLPDFLQRARPNKKERRLLAETGALNDLPDVQHRRDALWQIERPLQLELFSRNTGILSVSATTPTLPDQTDRELQPVPLPPMSPWQRAASDFATQNASTGPHPLRLWRRQLKDRTYNDRELTTAGQLPDLPHGHYVRIAGLVICRQRPQTAKGHCFITFEDETGIANIFVPRKTFEHYRLTITTEPFLLIEGAVQVGEGQVVSVYTHSLSALTNLPNNLETSSHDFH